MGAYNKPGKWVVHGSQLRFIAPGYAVYGIITPSLEVKDKLEIEGQDPWFWEARVDLRCRTNYMQPIKGFAPTSTAAIRIVETLMYQTNSAPTQKDYLNGK